MKRIFIILLIGLISRAPALAQTGVYFNFNFDGNPPPHTATVPDSIAFLSGGTFSAAIYLGDTAPSAGRIVQMGEGGSLTTIFDFPNPVFASYGAPFSGTAFSYEQTWQLTTPQIDSLLGGQWYADVSYGSVDYLGQITVAPEPSSIALFAGGLIAVALIIRRKCMSDHKAA
ncbi:MAG TPA: PEP-CTERM sorting domain-containing protein [Verrucomicrobiae bacterium]